MTGAERTGRSASLDAVRGLAAVAVATLHTVGVTGGGLTGFAAEFYGVLLEAGLAVFFVLSGYLISLPFVRALVDGTPMPSLRDYGRRRFARIVPGYWVAFAVTALVIATVPPALAVDASYGNGHLQFGDWLAAAFFVQGAVSDAANGVLLVMWTLCIEILFYALVPLLARLAGRHARTHSPVRVALTVLGIWGLCTLMQWQLGGFDSLHLGGHPLRWAYLQVMYVGLFCPGVLLAVARTDAAQARWRAALHRLNSPRVRAFGPLLAVVAIFGAYMVRHAGDIEVRLTLVAEWRRQPAAIAAMVVMALALSARGGTWHAVARVLAPLGTISYGVYLYHWVVLRTLVDRHVFPLAVPGWAGLLAKVGLALALTLPLAALSYLLVERPAMRWAARRSAGDHGVAQHAEMRDLQLDHVTRREPRVPLAAVHQRELEDAAGPAGP
jgi:peptidoglycan/LPS O-acetylase OafA/YrhL